MGQCGLDEFTTELKMFSGGRESFSRSASSWTMSPCPNNQAAGAVRRKYGVILVCPHTESVGQLQQTMVIRAAPRSEGAGHVLFAWDDGVASMQQFTVQSTTCSGPARARDRAVIFVRPGALFCMVVGVIGRRLQVGRHNYQL
jgi:hypothetical protein